MNANQVLQALEAVKDPEIPTISVVDMGIIRDVQVNEDSVHVVMTPTFVGCPAIAVMKADVEEVCKGLGFRNTIVDVNYDTPWSSNLISERGRAALLQHGLAPPEPYEETLTLRLDVLSNVQCPVCGSRDSTLKSPFGPTLCRSIHFCNTCKETFEAFKPL
jgi:ring-1,2-phenylacetyl-CoA epoxidase subunit PaaD